MGLCYCHVRVECRRDRDLRQAAATADEIALLGAELQASSLVVAGYSGQPRRNPLLKIIQDHRLLLRRLVDSSALPDEGEESGLCPGQRHARTAADARWRERAEGNGKLAELRAAGVQGDGDGSDASSAAYCEDAGRATQVPSGGMGGTWG